MTEAAAMNYLSLPLLASVDGGKFCGLTTQPNGVTCAVILLNDRPAAPMNRTAAVAWAAAAGGDLPSRAVAALLYANAKSLLKPEWHWVGDTNFDPGEWMTDFGRGHQLVCHLNTKGLAVAVRLVPITEGGAA